MGFASLRSKVYRIMVDRWIIGYIIKQGGGGGLGLTSNISAVQDNPHDEHSLLKKTTYSLFPDLFRQKSSNPMNGPPPRGPAIRTSPVGATAFSLGREPQATICRRSAAFLMEKLYWTGVIKYLISTIKFPIFTKTRKPNDSQYLLPVVNLKKSQISDVYWSACAVATGVAGKRVNRFDSPELLRQGGAREGSAPRKENGSDE